MESILARSHSHTHWLTDFGVLLVSVWVLSAALVSNRHVCQCFDSDFQGQITQDKTQPQFEIIHVFPKNIKTLIWENVIFLFLYMSSWYVLFSSLQPLHTPTHSCSAHLTSCKWVTQSWTILHISFTSLIIEHTGVGIKLKMHLFWGVAKPEEQAIFDLPDQKGSLMLQLQRRIFIYFSNTIQSHFNTVRTPCVTTTGNVIKNEITPKMY